MIVRAFLLALLVFASVTGFGGPASAFTSGVWEGGPNQDDNGKFSDCTMTAQSDSGVLLAFVISRNLDWGVALVDDRWSLDVGSVEDVALTVDSRKPIPAIAKVVDPHGILVPLENTDPVMKALRHGRKLTVSTPSDRLSFELTGTNEALATLANCVSEHLQAEKASGGPGISAQAKPASENKANPNKLFTPAEAMTFAANLLASAGITDYQLVDPAENPVANFDAVWTYPNGIIGALVGYKDMSAVDLDQAANLVMADDAKSCKGDFASGKKLSAPVDSLSVRRLYTACHTKGKSIEIHYTLVKTESGHLIQIAHLNMGNVTGDIANADSAFLQAAVLPSFK
jgi:hypothetical protein